MYGFNGEETLLSPCNPLTTFLQVCTSVFLHCVTLHWCQWQVCVCARVCVVGVGGCWNQLPFECRLSPDRPESCYRVVMPGAEQTVAIGRAALLFRRSQTSPCCFDGRHLLNYAF